MNDFTKEELENILNGNVELYPHTHMDLRNKIQFMIDNYCVHDPHGDFHVCVDKCKKCGVIINNSLD